MTVMMIQKMQSPKIFLTILQLVFLLLMHPAFVLSSFIPNIRCMERERQALLMFKQGVKDESDRLSSWGSEDVKKECCDWEGVRCSNETGYVVQLDLQGYPSADAKTLKGNITSSLMELHHLRYLDLSGNKISGEIPYHLGKLSLLQHLNLSRNQLEGEVPISFGNLCNLKALDLSGNDLKGQLTFIQNLSRCAGPSLESIHLDANNFTGSLPDFSVFPSLKVIDLSNNKLDGNMMEARVGNLLELEVLDVSFNDLGGVIFEEHLSNLSKLTVLGLSSTLKINPNWIPPFQLTKLILRSCKLGAPYNFPNWLKNQRMLSHLDISSLGISDTIPHWFQNLTSDEMRYLNISKNQIHGMLPASLSMGSLSMLDLSSNNLVGMLPQIQTDFLRLVDLSHNQFSGSIYPLCNSPISGFKITLLDVSNNQLSGTIPDDCTLSLSWTSLLSLANNNFSGKIPSSIGSLILIKTLDLHNNNFSGELPSSMGNCRNLRFLNLGGNKLSGKLPTWIGERLLDLKFLILGANLFDGSIPSSLCMLKNLQFLDLSLNHMLGIIPQCLDNLTAMAHDANSSEVKINEVHGVQVLLPSPWSEPDVDLISWAYLDRAMILLKGRIDEYKRNLIFLKLIDLSSNRLSGEFPSGILNLTGLVALNLSRNNLSGGLPHNIGQLNDLFSLDLSNNRFLGEIPTSLADLDFLSHLDLSYNNLSGRIPSGTQLQGFNSSVYAGNQALCGLPLANNCSTGGQPSTHHESSEDEFMEWLFIGMVSGFIVGFWGVCLVLFFNRACRHAYFLFLNKLVDRLLVRMAICKARLLRSGI